MTDIDARDDMKNARFYVGYAIDRMWFNTMISEKLDKSRLSLRNLIGNDFHEHWIFNLINLQFAVFCILISGILIWALSTMREFRMRNYEIFELI